MNLVTKTTQLIPKTLIVLQTHTWSASIDACAKTWNYSAIEYGHDFIVLCTGDAPPSIPRYFRTCYVRPVDAKNLYKVGFLNPWLSNHWYLMYLWTTLGYSKKDYSHIWSIEYDVRSYGNLDFLWGHSRPFHDQTHLITSTTINTFLSSYCWAKTITPQWRASKESPKHTCLKQVFRLTDDFLDYLHLQFSNGYNAQDELSLASHAIQYCKKKNISTTLGTDSLLRHHFLSSRWSTTANDSHSITRQWQSMFGSDTTKTLTLFHPIK